MKNCNTLRVNNSLDLTNIGIMHFNTGNNLVGGVGLGTKGELPYNEGAGG